MAHKIIVQVAAMISLTPLGSTAVSGAENDTAALRGSWRLVSVTDNDGEQVNVPEGMIVKFENDMVVVWAGMKKSDAMRFKLDSSKSPAHIDLIPRAKRPAEGTADVVQRGIYKIDGDMLTLSMPVLTISMEAPPDIAGGDHDARLDQPKQKLRYKINPRPRPSSFDEGHVFVYKRVKE